MIEKSQKQVTISTYVNISIFTYKKTLIISIRFESGFLKFLSVFQTRGCKNFEDLIPRSLDIIILEIVVGLDFWLFFRIKSEFCPITNQPFNSNSVNEIVDGLSVLWIYANCINFPLAVVIYAAHYSTRLIFTEEEMILG